MPSQRMRHLSPGNLLTWFGSWNHLVERIIHSESHTAGTCITAASCILICARGYHPNVYLYIMYAVWVDLLVRLRHVHVAWCTYAKPAHAASQPRESANVVRLLESSRRENHRFQSLTRQVHVLRQLRVFWYAHGDTIQMYMSTSCCMSGFTCEAAPRACSKGGLCRTCMSGFTCTLVSHWRVG